jgi:hypothetical protein
MFSDYKQIVRGISDVFKVGETRRSRNTTVTIHNITNGFYPGQTVSATIYKPDSPPFGLRIVAAFVPAKDRVAEYVNRTKNWISLDSANGVIWNTTATNLTVSAKINFWTSGWFKLVIMAADDVIGVSKSFIVRRPCIRISLPKRIYSQWESIPILENKVSPYVVTGYSTVFSFLPTNTTDSYFNQNTQIAYMGGREQHGYEVNVYSNIVAYPPGIYNIRLMVYKTWWSGSWSYAQLVHVASVSNTTFAVVENQAKLLITNNKANFKYGDDVSFSLTTTNKVPIYGNFNLYSTFGWSIISDIVQSNTSSDLSVINGSITIDFSNVGCPGGRSPYVIQFYVKKFVDSSNDLIVYSPKIFIDDKSKPAICLN